MDRRMSNSIGDHASGKATKSAIERRLLCAERLEQRDKKKVEERESDRKQSQAHFQDKLLKQKEELQKKIDEKQAAIRAKITRPVTTIKKPVWRF